MDSFYLKNGLGIGNSFPIRVNCNFGINRAEDENYEKYKVDNIFAQKAYRPDLAMDLSTIKTKTPIYDSILNYNIPVGTVPIYLSFKKNSGIEINEFIEIINEQAESGIAFFTLHFTADIDLYEKAIKYRRIPITSRGGGILLSDQILKGTRQNLLVQHIDDIIKVCKKKNIAISLGTTFRPASIIDACDEVHLIETKRQLEINKYLKGKGVNTIIENIGHISINRIKEHVEMLKEFDSPIMPLGPFPTDIGLENDHIVASIGAAFLSYWGGAHIINSITPNEHTHSNIEIDATIKGIEAAKITSQIINLTKSKQYWQIERKTYYSRASNRNCLDGKEKCYRCGDQCPLINFTI